MAPTLVVEYTHDDSDNNENFNYDDFRVSDSPRVHGAFRVVKVKPLLGKPQKVQVYEYSHIRWGAGGGSLAYKGRLAAAQPYVAVSHVWSHADDVDDKLNTTSVLDPFNIDVDPSDDGTDYKKVGWVGLKQVAQTADKYGIKYLWIDFFCIDQIAKNNDNEMGLQICIMADIYRYAQWVMVMIGGMAAAVKAKDVTSWMDRAWTLQEAVVNPNVWVVLLWDPTNLVINHKKFTWRFLSIGKGYKAGFDICIIKLVSLLDLADAGTGITTTPVNVVDGAFTTPGDVARRALRLALARKNPQIQYTGVWRSMYLRTSSKPADVVYSIMGIFRLQIDPFRKNRDPNYLFNDLARKVAVKPGLGPAWLTIGGVTGSDILRNQDSRIVFKFPHPEGAGEPSKNEPPKMKFLSGGPKEWVGYHVDDSEWYIKRYNIKVLSQAHPHLIDAVMLGMSDRQSKKNTRLVPRVTPPRPPPLKPKNYVVRHSAQFYIAGYSNFLVWNGDLSNASSRKIQAVFVGEVGNINSGIGGRGLNISNEIKIPKGTPVDYSGMSFFLFMEFTSSRRWQVVADGVFQIKASKFINKRRKIFTVGSGSQKVWSSWPTVSQTGYTHRFRTFRHSYGVEPLRDWLVASGQEQQRNIEWFGFKNETPNRGIPWTPQNLAYDISAFLGDPKLKELNKKLDKTHALSIVSTSALWNQVPQTAKSQTTWKIRENEAVQIPFSYGGWTRSQCSDLAKSGVDGILLHDPNTDPSSDVDYQVRLRFGDRVMYFQFKQDVNTKHYWSQTYVVPYRQTNDNLPVINSSYVYSVPKVAIYPSPCAPVTELGLPLGASNREIGQAIARALVQEFGLPYDQAENKAMYMWGTNLSGAADVKAMELRKRYCFRGLDIGNYYNHPQDFIPW